MSIPQEYFALTAQNPPLCVYAISGIDTGKVYFGETDRGLRERMAEHAALLRKEKHYNDPLQNFFSKYGAASLVSFVVEESSNLKELDDAEKKQSV